MKLSSQQLVWVVLVASGVGILRAQEGWPNPESGPVVVKVASAEPALLPKGVVVLWFNPGDCPKGFKKMENVDGLFLRVGKPNERGGKATHTHRITTDLKVMALQTHVYNMTEGSVGQHIAADTASNEPPFINAALCQMQ